LFVSVINSPSVFPALFPEGTPGSKRILPWQKSLDAAPVGGRLLTFMAGAGGGDVATVRVPRNGTVTVSIRCVGPAPVSLTVDDGTRQARSQQAQCDGSTPPVDGQETLRVHRGDRLQIADEANKFTLFAVGVYLVF
jgi:hypothetical protein